MSDEEHGDDASGSEAATTTSSAEETADEAAQEKERVDEDGLPLDRDPTIDDVRSQEGLHGRIAFGCTLFVVLVLVLFWLIRGGFIG